jgi:prevent-host-death family protein
MDRDNLSEIVDDAAINDNDYVITRHGRPVAVILGYDGYESLLESLNILSDAETMDALAEAESDIENDDLSEA